MFRSAADVIGSGAILFEVEQTVYRHELNAPAVEADMPDVQFCLDVNVYVWT